MSNLSKRERREKEKFKEFERRYQREKEKEREKERRGREVEKKHSRQGRFDGPPRRREYFPPTRGEFEEKVTIGIKKNINILIYSLILKKIK